MAEWVVDTNVLLVATRHDLGTAPRQLAERGDDVPVQDLEEQERVFLWLKRLHDCPDDRIVLDEPNNLIYGEYKNKLEKHELGRRVIVEMFQKCRVHWVEVVVDANGDGVIPGPHGELVTDRADRKMVAAAMASAAPIANACDTDWMDLQANGSLETLGITVHEVIEPWCRAEWHRKHGTSA